MRFLVSALILTMLVGTISLLASRFDKTSFSHAFVAMGQTESQGGWHMNDTLMLTPGWAEWWHKEYTPEPWVGIEKGYTFEFHVREYLMSQNDVFFEIKEVLNWTVVLEDYLFPVDIYDWEMFEAKIDDDPNWWLEYRVYLDCERYGISANSTYNDVRLEEDRLYMTVTCHVTRVAELLITRNIGTSGSGIFDLRSISFGKLETYEYSIDYYQYLGQLFYNHFLAPSSILEESQEIYNATMYTDPLKGGTPSRWDRTIMIMMPSATVVTEAETKSYDPTAQITNAKAADQIDRNMAIFSIQQNETLPDSFTVESTTPPKTLLDMFLTPGTLTGLATALVTIPGIIKGVSMFRRHRRYNRLMRLTVKLYHEYKSNPNALENEMGNLTESIFTAFIDDKLTDEQLEKLLHRRDDLLARLHSGTPSSN